jgi:hypothetical protein
MFLDAGQCAHPVGDLHRRTEVVDGVASGFAQRGRAFDDGDVEAAPSQPVGQHRTGDARTGDQNPHADSSMVISARWRALSVD